MSYLINRNILKQKKGNYGDNLVITGKFGSKIKKQRYVTPPIYNYMLKLHEKDRQELVDMDKVNKNQRYLFENNSNSVCAS